MERWKKRYALWTTVAVLCAVLFVGCTTGPAADRETRDPEAWTG